MSRVLVGEVQGTFNLVFCEPDRMTPLPPETEEQLKEKCRKIFYESVAVRISAANQGRAAIMCDLVRGDNSILNVLFDVPLQRDTIAIFPLAVYKFLEEQSYERNPSC